MPIHVPIYSRLTRLYVDGWRYLDEHRYLGTVKLLAGKTVDKGNGYDRGPTFVNQVYAPAHLSSQNLTAAIADTLGGSRCRHEHDCCGCPSTLAIVRRRSRRTYVVRCTVYYNF